MMQQNMLTEEERIGFIDMSNQFIDELKFAVYA